MPIYSKLTDNVSSHKDFKCPTVAELLELKLKGKVDALKDSFTAVQLRT